MTNQTTNSFISKLWKIIVDQLKGKFVTLALKKFLGSGAALGIKGWIVQYIATHLFEEVAVPFLDYIYRKGWLLYDREQGKIKYKKLVKAKERNDEDTYNDVIDSV